MRYNATKHVWIILAGRHFNTIKVRIIFIKKKLCNIKLAILL